MSSTHVESEPSKVDASDESILDAPDRPIPSREARTTEPTPTWTFDNKHLRFIFVAFLFSYSIARLGEAAFALYDYEGADSIWPGATHLVLAFVVITTSWVNWAANVGRGPPLKDIFSLQYFLLLLDLVLVMLYLAIVKKAEVPAIGKALQVSAVPESKLLAFVYLLYAGWDFVNDIWQKPPVQDESAKPTFLERLCASIVRCGASGSCMLFAGLVVLVARGSKPEAFGSVYALNFAEIANAVLFRCLKIFEFQRDSSLHIRYREGVDRYEEKRTLMRQVTGVAFAAYVIALLAAFGWNQLA